jgi:hypothetical protein
MTDPATLRVLQAEIRSGLNALDRLDDEIGPLGHRVQIPGAPQGDVVQAAFLLHNAYNACESILRRIATAFENALTPGRWHEELLRRMTLEIPDVRPAVMDEALRERLDALRRFRHFFRHSYAVQLRGEEVAARLRDYQAAGPAFRQAIARFLQAVDAMLHPPA